MDAAEREHVHNINRVESSGKRALQRIWPVEFILTPLGGSGETICVGSLALNKAK